MSGRLRILLAAGTLALSMCCINAYFGNGQRIASVPLQNDYLVRIWTEYEGLRNWDPDHVGRDIYFDVLHHGKGSNIPAI
jgi:hypothetical protein